MTRIQRLSTGALAIAMAFATAATARADEPASSQALCTMFYNGCFYPQTWYSGPEYKTIIYYAGCWGIPDTVSYRVSAARTVTLYSGNDCTGQSHAIPGGWGFNPGMGFTARSYHYPPA